MKALKKIVRRHWFDLSTRSIALNWNKENDKAALNSVFPMRSIKPPRSKFSRRIEKLSDLTNSLGPLPLWDGYGKYNFGGTSRLPESIRTTASLGDLYTSMVTQLKPKIIVEFGTGFGVSGMFFLAGLEANGAGKLLTFEVNSIWAEIAEKNLKQISDRFSLIVGTFEDNIETVLPKNMMIDIAFIDGIHAVEFVESQVEIVLSRSRSGSIILVDDINFSGEMAAFWDTLSRSPRFLASATLEGRVGALEVK